MAACNAEIDDFFESEFASQLIKLQRDEANKVPCTGLPDAMRLFSNQPQPYHVRL
jgi:hypothetical protein